MSRISGTLDVWYEPPRIRDTDRPFFRAILILKYEKKLPAAALDV